ncbi:C1 family peptidase [Legionella micdadei]|uniref:Cysteine protease, papain C1 family n=1 Tax=Legionella micdadei TaxID=451 RepID=A0A098GK05_LEGMI|nr:C1 family peptidase [Legionella micdadei]ARG98722.1 peptidase C1 [Legionella micdadei]ARH01441.1 peptidase C1 [Legionella micdadei]KTD28939.1 cysteine protease [Legionella micdadei]NSL17151.1 C1 family peptidase [Legionella micdadei]CEG62320.1 Cysteine protease, papain C1 family [Legionella micdadei]
MKLAHFALLSMIFTGNVIAQDIKIVGTITQPVKAPYSSERQIAPGKASETTGKITLLKVELSDKAKTALASRAKNALAHTKQFATSTYNSAYPEKVELGMGNVPVLNQGMHGTCVTFAVSAAIDAVLNKGDYVSQLCSLQLGNYLEKNAYFPSGWEGSWGRFVLDQLAVFGIVNKEHQQSQGCGGLTVYPVNDMVEPSGYVNLEDYRQMSEDIGEKVLWSPVLDIYQALLDRTDTNKTVEQVKAALNAGDRLTFGVLLLDFDLGFAGAVGKNKVDGDTWVLTPEIARDVYLKQNFGGHEMVITGYDDNAVAIDDQGREHRGLFTLRNSWGKKVGDQGDFYMSYDYFKLLVIEVARIRNVSDNAVG